MSKINIAQDGRRVWHAGWVEELTHCVWVDPEEMSWAHWHHPAIILLTGERFCIHHAKRIDLLPRLIVIDGADGAEGDAIADEHSRRTPTKQQPVSAK